MKIAELKYNGQILGNLVIGDSAQDKITSLQNEYLGTEHCADAAMLPVSINVHGSIFAQLNLRGLFRVDGSYVDISKDKVLFYLTINGTPMVYDITN